MSNDKTGKTRLFVKKGLQLWLIILIFYFGINFVITQYAEPESFGFGEELLGIVFIFGVCCLPLILFLSIVLKIVSRLIDRF